MNKPQLIISGSIAIDRIMNFSGQYRDLIEAGRLESLSVSVLVDSVTQAYGGTGANIAYNLALLGEKPVLLGSVGEDGGSYIKRLKAAGVDTSRVHESRLPTASFNVLTDSSENQIGGFYPGAMSDSAGLTLETWGGQDVIVCISSTDPAAMRRQTEECHSFGLKLMYDPGQQVSNIPGEDLLAGVEAAEIVIVNEYENGVLLQKTGLTAEELQAKVPVLIVTHGKNGSIISGSKFAEPLKIEPAVPDKIADPTGAGDAYRAGFLYGYLRQSDSRICGRLGSVVASFVLEQAGPQADISPDTIMQRYKKTFNEEITL